VLKLIWKLASLLPPTWKMLTGVVFSSVVPSKKFTVPRRGGDCPGGRRSYDGRQRHVLVHSLRVCVRLHHGRGSGPHAARSSCCHCSAAGSNPATFQIALSGKKPGFCLLYMFAAFGNEGTS
jgi:hypothetical protein